MPKPTVIHEPQLQTRLSGGINIIADAIRPTLGPLPRAVAVANVQANKPPELLDNGAAIARRIFQLPDRTEDVGAMILRHTLWQVHEAAGDATATAALLFQAIYTGGRRFITAGGDAMQLRDALQDQAHDIVACLDALSVPVRDKAQLIHVAESICGEKALSRALGEAFDLMGAHGQLDIRSAYGRDIGWQYVDGAYWERGIETTGMLAGEEFGRAVAADAAVLISDLKLDEPRALLPLVVGVMRAGHRGLLLIADSFSDEVKTFLLANQDTRKFAVIPVRTPFTTPDEQLEAMRDIALLTGGKPIVSASGQSLSSLNLADLGKARQVYASRSLFGFSSGGADPMALRHEAGRLMSRIDSAPDAETRQKLQARLGKLLGGSVTLHTGGATESEIEYRRDLAKRSAQVLRDALRDGIVPGAGTALLLCRKCLLDDGDSLAQRAASHILREALVMPTRVIADNAGNEGGAIVAQLLQQDAPHCFDARSGKLLPVNEAGIYDVSSALKCALLAAVSGAGQALTIEAVVHHRDPDMTYEP